MDSVPISGHYEPECPVTIARNTQKALVAQDEGANSWSGYAFQKEHPQRELFAQAFTAFQFDPKALHDNALKTYMFFKEYLGRQEDGSARSALGAGPRDGQPSGVHEAQARLIEAAHANDPALHQELSTSDDVKGLQRAIVAMTDRLEALSNFHAYSDSNKYPATLAFLGIAKTAGQMGVKGRGLLKSPEFQAALREITARNVIGDEAAPHLRDQLLANAFHLASIIGDGPMA